MLASWGAAVPGGEMLAARWGAEPQGSRGKRFSPKFSAFPYCDFFHSKYYPCNLLHIAELLETASCFNACQIPPQLPGRE